jgi:hypothetical protein
LRLIATQVFAEIWRVKYRVSSPGMHMSNRTAKFVSAIFASFLAGTAVTTLSFGAALAANEAKAVDNCLAGPKGQTPAGGHWYYRIDHATKRHCWYLGDEGEKVARDARPEPAASEKVARDARPEPAAPAPRVAANPVSPQKQAPTQRTIADARAELPPPQTQIEPASAATGQWPAAAAPNMAAPNMANEPDSQPANAGDTNTQSSLIASRWPESSGVRSSASAGPAIANSDANMQPDSRAAEASVVPPPASVVAAAPLAAADSSSASRTGSIQMLLIVIAGALAFAGVLATAVFRLGSLRRAGRRKIHGGRRAIWDSVDTGRPPPPPFGRGDVPVRRVDIPRKPREVDDASRRIAEMLAQLHEAGRTERSAISPAAAAKRSQIPRDRSGARA